MKKFIIRQHLSHIPRNVRESEWYDTEIIAEYFIENKTSVDVKSVTFYNNDGIIVQNFDVQFDYYYQIFNENGDIISSSILNIIKFGREKISYICNHSPNETQCLKIEKK
jgi:Fe-S-cluster formation regulator IscX/YfhJ